MITLHHTESTGEGGWSCVQFVLLQTDLLWWRQACIHIYSTMEPWC